MTTATKLKQKLSNLEARIERLAQFGAYDDRMRSKLDQEIGNVAVKFDKIDRELAVELAGAEQRALNFI